MRLCRDDSRFRNDYTQALLKFLKRDEASPVMRGVQSGQNSVSSADILPFELTMLLSR